MHNLSKKANGTTSLDTAMYNQVDKDQESYFQETVSEAFINHLVDLRERDAEFGTLLKRTFGEKLDDLEFFYGFQKN